MKRALIVCAVAAVSLGAQARRPVSLVVTGGIVLTENATHAILTPGAVAIDGVDIVEVGSPAAIASKYQAA
jgi:hypothetical protein